MEESPQMTAATTTPLEAEQQLACREVVSFSEIERHFPIFFPKGSPTCVICLATIEKTDPCRKTTCNHEFHADCIMKWWTKEQGSLLNCPTCRETQCVTVTRVRQVNSEVRQKQKGLCQKPLTRLLTSLRAVPRSVRTPSSEATAASSNVLLRPSQAASQMPNAE